MDAVIRERDDSGPRLPDEEETLAGDERVGGGQLLLLLHRRPHREHLGSLHHCEHNLHSCPPERFYFSIQHFDLAI